MSGKYVIRRVIASVYISGLVFLAIALRFFSWDQIETVLHGSPVQCPLKRFTSLKCAFCGMTHSWIALLRGEWRQSFQENSLGPVLFLAVAAYAVAVMVRPVDFKLTRVQVAFGVVVLIVYAIARNFLE